jgi:hypothetical protein
MWEERDYEGVGESQAGDLRRGLVAAGDAWSGNVFAARYASAKGRSEEAIARWHDAALDPSTDLQRTLVAVGALGWELYTKMHSYPLAADELEKVIHFTRTSQRGAAYEGLAQLAIITSPDRQAALRAYRAARDSFVEMAKGDRWAAYWLNRTRAWVSVLERLDCLFSDPIDLKRAGSVAASMPDANERMMAGFAIPARWMWIARKPKMICDAGLTLRDVFCTPAYLELLGERSVLREMRKACADARKAVPGSLTGRAEGTRDCADGESCDPLRRGRRWPLNWKSPCEE